MKIYFIDYENVSTDGLKGVELLEKNDEVQLIYTDHTSKSISL